MKKVTIFTILVALMMTPVLAFSQIIEGDVTYDSPAPNWVIEKANTHIVSYVGENYFEANVSLKESYRVSFTFQEDQFKIIYSYRIPLPAEEITTKAKEFITWLDKDGNVFDYTGPRKPYQFSITEEEAIAIAKNNGIQNPVEAIIDTVYDSQVPPRFFGDYAWVIRNNPIYAPCPETPGSLDTPVQKLETPVASPGTPVTKPAQCGFSQKIAYIEVDTGAVLNAFTWTGSEKLVGPVPAPAPQVAPVPGPTPTPTPSPSSGPTPSPTPPLFLTDYLTTLLVIVITIIVIVVLIGFFFYYRKKQ